MKRIWWVVCIAAAALCTVLYWIHPVAPLLLLLSLLVQAPFIWLISRANFKRGYLERQAERRLRVEEDGDPEAWLRAEEAEANSVGYRYWSSAGRALCALNRADALLRLGRGQEAREFLETVERGKLAKEERERFDALWAEAGTVEKNKK